jgi:hypothetical protein
MEPVATSEASNIRSILQVWLPNKLRFVLLIMMALNLVCRKVFGKYMEAVTTFSYHGLYC